MKYIKDIKPDEKIESVYLLKKKELKRTKENKPYLTMVLADKTGAIEAKVWDDADTVEMRIGGASAVHIKGVVVKYRENIQFKVDHIRPADENEYSPSDLIRSLENPEEIFDKIVGYIKSIENKWLNLLAMAILDDVDLREKFMRSPGAQNWHNAYIGGLMEHTYEVMYITDHVCSLYPEASRDICLIGAFCHDIGKTVELDPSKFEYTVQGGLIGHLTLGFEILSRKIAGIPGFPEDLATHLKHGILSHHGEYEQQSPVLPKTLEATIVYHADELVSQANAIKELIQAQSGLQKVWSNFVSIKNRKYLLTKPEDL